MLATIDVRPSPPSISQTDAQSVACAYVMAHLDPTFEVVSGAKLYSKPRASEIWQFMIRCGAAPLGVLAVDAHTGAVLPLTADEIQVVREKAMIAAARLRGTLPVNGQGFILAEYARRQADSYLGAEVSLFYSATNGVFVPLTHPIWQFTIQVRLPRLGILGLMGTLDVDARTGEVIPLTNQQIKRIRERADALVEFQTQPTTA
jgi:hypothetical protein